MKTRAFASIASLVVLAACNTITGADEPEVVEDDGASAGAGLATDAATTSADATTGAGQGGGGADHGDLDTTSGGESLQAACGNGDRAEDEECDDGNAEPGDGCSEICRLECGAGESARVATSSCVAASAPGDERTWDDAAAACAERGGALALFADLDVATFEGRLADLHHVGARRADDGAFEWIDGSTVAEEVVIGNEEGHDCLALTVELSDGARLRAVPCDERLLYLCERDPSSGG